MPNLDLKRLFSKLHDPALRNTVTKAFERHEVGMDVVSYLPMGNESHPIDSPSQRFLSYIASSDTAILDALLADHLHRAYCQARRLLDDGSEAEDAVQEAFLELVRTAARFDGSIPFVAWLGRIVHHAALQALRARGRRRRYEDRARTEAVRETQPQLSMDNDMHTADAVRAAVRDLPERYRATIDLHYFAGLSRRDTAKALGTNENAIGVRLHRARECLRSLLQRRGVAVTGSVVVLALDSAPAYAAPTTLSVNAASLIAHCSQGTAMSAGMTAATASITTVFSAPVLIAAALIAVGGASAWFMRGDQQVASQPRLDRQWTFEKWSPNDLDVRDGTWQWQDGSPGRMVVGAETVMLVFPDEIPPAPLMIRLKVMAGGQNAPSFCGSYWSDGEYIYPHRYWQFPSLHRDVEGQSYILTSYFLGSHAFQYADDQLISIDEYDLSYPARKICVGLRNLTVEEITLQAFEDRDLPSLLREPQALQIKMSSAPTVVERQAFPPRKKSNGD